MRKLLFTFMSAGIIALFACGGDKKENKAENKTGTEPQTETKDISANPDYAAGLELIGKNDCLTCHRTSGKVVGPSYEDVAAKYAGADDKKIEELAQTIIKGVKVADSKWGSTQEMTAHPNLPLDDAKKMVKYILLLKK